MCILYIICRCIDNSIFKLGRHVDWWWTMESRGSSLVGLGWLGFENCWWSIDSEPLPKLHILINLAYLFRSDRPTLSQFLEVSVCCVLHETTKMGVALASLCGTLANFEPRSSDTTGSQRRWDVELHAHHVLFALPMPKLIRITTFCKLLMWVVFWPLLADSLAKNQEPFKSFTTCVSAFQFGVRLKMGPRLVLVDPEVGLGAHGDWAEWYLLFLNREARKRCSKSARLTMSHARQSSEWLGAPDAWLCVSSCFSRGSEQVCSSVACNDTERYGTHVQHVT